MQPGRELYRLMSAPQRRSFVLLHGLALVMAAATVAGIAAVAPFFALLADPQRIGHSALLSWLQRIMGRGGEREFLLALGAASLAVILTANAINWLGSLAMGRFAHRVGNYLAVRLFDYYLHRDYRSHRAHSNATLLNNVVWECSRGTTGIVQYYFVLIVSAAASLLIIASLFIVNPLLAATSFAILGSGYCLIYLLLRHRLQRNGQLESRHTEARSRVAAEGFEGFKEISLLRAQCWFRDQFQRSCDALARAAINTQAIAQSPRYLMEALVIGGLVLAAMVLLDQGGARGPWLAQLTYLGLASYRLLPALQQIFLALVRMRADRVAFVRLLDDLRRACAQPSAACAALAPAWRDRPLHGIKFDAVWFRYDDQRPAILEGAQLEIQAGSTVGIVGPSGCGKTTLAELLLGLLTPGSGRILVDGIALDAGNRSNWQAVVAYVPQQVFMFDATLAENIALGIDAGHIDPQRLSRAARLAQLEPLVHSLPGGYRERLGEHGVRLSGGQRQRIGIARALYRQASVLVLDEATNALDRLTEDEIMTTLEALRGRCTVILIAHRLSATLRCDRILSVRDGRVTDVLDEASRRAVAQ